MRGVNVFIGVVGAALILTALFGIVVIEQRAGPYDYVLAPASLVGAFSGSFESRPAVVPPVQAPADCGLPSPVEPCEPASTRIELRLEGFPPDAPVHIVAFLRGAAGALRVGELVPAAEALAFAFTDGLDSSGYDELVVSLHVDPDDAEPSALHLHRVALGGQAERHVDLAGALGPLFPDATGSLRLSQVGAVTVSVLATAKIEGILPLDGFTYRGWLLPEDGRPPVLLGDFTFEGPARGVFDERVERISVGEQGSFIVMLEGDGGPLPVFGVEI